MWRAHLCIRLEVTQLQQGGRPAGARLPRRACAGAAVPVQAALGCLKRLVCAQRNIEEVQQVAHHLISHRVAILHIDMGDSLLTHARTPTLPTPPCQFQLPLSACRA